MSQYQDFLEILKMNREVGAEIIPDLLHVELIRGDERFQKNMQEAFNTDWNG